MGPLPPRCTFPQDCHRAVHTPMTYLNGVINGQHVDALAILDVSALYGGSRGVRMALFDRVQAAT